MNQELLSETVACIKDLSKQEFACVIGGLGLLLQNLIKVFLSFLDPMFPVL